MANTQAILKILAKDFPNAKSELNFNNPYELIVAVILSAQCTDKRVNLVTPALFEVAPTPEKLANLPLEQIEQIIRPCGFYHSKATYLKEMAHDLVVRFDGQVPQNLADLQTLRVLDERRQTWCMPWHLADKQLPLIRTFFVFPTALVLQMPKTFWIPKSN